MTNIDDLIARLSLEEKESLVGGNGMWTVPAVERLGIPSLKVTDGPNGARGDGLLGTGKPALCIPCGSALGATWNPDLLARLGAVLGEEARTKGSHVLLAPTINIHRSPVAGRNFECYSEDPLLSGKLAAAYIRGVQSQHVACTPKHFVGNDAEFERNTINSVIDDRTLREIYLLPFELAVTEGKAWGLMGAYNRLNGTFCCENPWLLETVLKDEWGFDGFVVTDWFATRSTVDAANAGLDLEMPGPGRMWGGGKLADAVRSGQVSEAVLDEKLRRMLRVLERTKAFDEPMDGSEVSIDRPEHRALAREAATESMVLLRNEGVLPLDASKIARLAVIGPNADRAQIMGGGSAKLRAFHYTTPLDAIRAHLGDDVAIEYQRGCLTDKLVPPLRGPLEVEFFDGQELAGPVIGTREFPEGRVAILGKLEEAAAGDQFSMRMRTRLCATEPGLHQLALLVTSWTRVLVDGQLVIDAWRSGIERGKEMFGLASIELTHDLELDEGQVVEIVVECSNREAILAAGFQLGLRPPARDDLIDRAVEAAARADAAIVIVGTNDDWETEGYDRDSMDLPGRSDELVRRVAAANPATVVVVNAGSPVAMPWADEAPAILDVWFGGQEMAPALADVLFGEAAPTGKLATTFPVRLEHNPSFSNFPGENSELRYGEGLFVGYRHYDTMDREPRFGFGHGLSYSSFEIGEPRPSKTALSPHESLQIEVSVTNTGERRAAEVVQCYVEPLAPRLARPLRELKAFEKLWIDPGATVSTTLTLDARAFAYWDPGDPDYARLSDGSPVPAGGGGDRRDEAGWVVDPGRYRVHIGASSRDLRHAFDLEIKGNR